MFVERNTNLDEILFDVEQRPIYLDSKNEHQRNLFDGSSQLRFKRIPEFWAVTNVEDEHVFSVVKPGYKLITNKEAIELGKQCFKSVFGSMNVADMEVFHITYPKSKSFCHMDFTLKDSGFEPWQGDKWVPFLRVTNSYNRTKPLRFNFGFCRGICTNGIIFGERSITYKYTHTRGDAGKAEFNTNIGELKKIEAQFTENLHNLQRYHVPEKFMLPIVCRAFGIMASREDLEKPKRLLQLSGFKNHIDQLTKRYFDEMGQNGYAALNVLTDFASRPAAYISPEVMVDQLQKSSGKWAEEFINEIKDDRFRFESYLGDYLGTAQILNTLN